MNTNHMAGLNRYRVKITFTDGIYEIVAHCESADQAIALASADARMGNGRGHAFFGKCLKREAVQEPANDTTSPEIN